MKNLTSFFVKTASLAHLKKGTLLFLALLMAVPSRDSLAAPLSSTPYQVRPGDELMINIRVVGELITLNQLALSSPLSIVGRSIFTTHHVTVSPDGAIGLPSVRLNVNGLTLEEIEGEILKRINLPEGHNPVSVSLLKSSSAFYVWGEVKYPGKQPLDRPLTLFEALSVAGGPTPEARLSDIRLIRAGGGEISFNLSYKKEIPPNIQSLQIFEKDTLIINRRRSADLAGIMLFLTILSTFAWVYVASQS